MSAGGRIGMSGGEHVGMSGGGWFASVRAAVKSAALMAAVLASACQEPPHPLHGEWVSVGSAGPAMTYIFEGDGRLTWVLDLPEGPDTLAVDYRLDLTTTPFHFDVGPWSTGPITGRTLFGILETLGPDRFRVDFEPGDPDTGAAERPAEFSIQTVTFVRKRN